MSEPPFANHGIIRRQTTTSVPGYTTTDDFGTDGNNTLYSEIPEYDQPNDVQGNASFPTNGSMPNSVDLVLVEFLGSLIIPILKGLGGTYTNESILPYMDPVVTSDLLLPAYAQIASSWKENMPNCPVRRGVGFNN